MQKIFYFVFSYLFYAATVCNFSAHAVEALKADLSYDGKNTYFLVRLSDAFSEAAYFTIDKPDRLIIDLPELTWKVDKQFFPAGAVSGVRFGNRDNGDGRIVLDLRAPSQIVSVSVTPHPSAAGYGLLRVALSSDRKFPVIAAGGSASSTPNRPIQNRPTNARSVEPRRQVRIEQYMPRVPAKKQGEFLAVIDAGHGGKDSGAIAVNRLYEKDLVLLMAQELAREINRLPHARAVLTRNSDFFIPLEARSKIADRLHADVFISVHADAVANDPNGTVQGATIYTLANEASDAEAAALAQQENLSDVIAGVELEKDSAPEVKDILIDLAQRETNSYSDDIAAHVARALSTVSPMHKKPLRKAGLMVLKSADTPSILIETGYLTSEADVRRLSDPVARAQKARAIASALSKWRLSRR